MTGLLLLRAVAPPKVPPVQTPTVPGLAPTPAEAHAIQRPGIRGGKWYRAKGGDIRYGEAPHGQRDVHGGAVAAGWARHAPTAAHGEKLQEQAHAAAQAGATEGDIAAGLTRTAMTQHLAGLRTAPTVSDRMARLSQMGTWLGAAADQHLRLGADGHEGADAALAQAHKKYQAEGGAEDVPAPRPSRQASFEPRWQRTKAAKAFIERGENVRSDRVERQMEAHAADQIGQRLETHAAHEPAVAHALDALGEEVLGPGGNHRELARVLNRAWNITAADHNHLSLAIQHGAAAEFGLGDDALRRLADVTGAGRKWKGLTAHYHAHATAYRAYARAIYDETQAQLAAHGITEVPLCRGMSLPRADVRALVPEGVLGKPRPVAVEMNPLSSWSADERTSYEFSMPQDAASEGLFLKGMIPASRVWSTARSGAGVPCQHEYVLLGTPGKVLGEVRPYREGA